MLLRRGHIMTLTSIRRLAAFHCETDGGAIKFLITTYLGNGEAAPTAEEATMYDGGDFTQKLARRPS